VPPDQSPTKPFPWPHEAILKQNGTYPVTVYPERDHKMQFILELIWDLSRSEDLAVLPQEQRA
jgi:hypothetical protein